MATALAFGESLNCPDLTVQVVFNPEEGPVDFGGSADIYQGQFENILVALKLPRVLTKYSPADTQKRFLREIKRWNELDHPNILKMLGILSIDGDTYIVSPWAKYGTVLAYVRNNPRVQRYSLLLGVISAVAYLHDKNIVHGDIKGGNILINDDGEPTLTDFGLSKDNSAVTSSTLKGVGSVRWTAPELLNGSTKTMASDVYAVAMVIYEVLTGEVPFAAITSDAIVMMSVMNGGRPSLLPKESASAEPYLYYWSIAESGWQAEISRRPNIHDLLSKLQKLTPPAIIKYTASPLTSVVSLALTTPIGDVEDASEATILPHIIFSGDMYLSSGKVKTPSIKPIRYHFSLAGTNLNYYSHINNAQELIGSIDLLKYAQVKRVTEHSLGYQFSLVGGEQNFTFFVDNKQDATQWPRMITKAMIQVRPESLTMLSGTTNFKKSGQSWWYTASKYLTS